MCVDFNNASSRCLTKSRRIIFLTVLVVMVAANKSEARQLVSTDIPPVLAQDDYTTVIDRGLMFLHMPNPSYHPFNFLFLDYLARKFDLGDDYLYENMYRFHKFRSDYEVLMLRLAFGLLLPHLEPDMKSLALTQPGADRLMMNAIYCGRQTPALDIRDVIAEQAQREGYDLIVAVLAFQWGLEQGCFASDEKTEALRDELAAQLVDMIYGEPDVTAAMLEGVALLLYLGETHMLLPQWIEAIVRAQQEDGGWSVLGPKAAQPSEHYPTLRALWVLLEAQFPFAKSIPFARTPLDVPQSDVRIEALFDAVARPTPLSDDPDAGLADNAQP